MLDDSMKHLTLLSCLILLTGCATRGLWEPDNKMGFIIRSEGTESVRIGQIGKHIQLHSQSGVIADLEIDSQIGKLKVEKVDSTKCLNNDIKYEIQLVEGNRATGLVVSDKENLNYDLTYEVTLVKFSQVPSPKYDAERVVGRIVLTPFAVATDVVIVATAVIWYPVMVMALGSETH
jgi:hypothetical protein